MSGDNKVYRSQLQRELGIDYDPSKIYGDNLVLSSKENVEKHLTQDFISKFSSTTSKELDSTLIQTLNKIDDGILRQQVAFDLSVTLETKFPSIGESFFNKHSFYRVRIGKSIAAHEEIILIDSGNQMYKIHGDIFNDGITGKGASIMRATVEPIEYGVRRVDMKFMEHLSTDKANNVIDNISSFTHGSYNGVPVQTSYITDYGVLCNNCRDITKELTMPGYASKAPSTVYKPQLISQLEKGEIPLEIINYENIEFNNLLQRYGNFTKDYTQTLSGEQTTLLIEQINKAIKKSKYDLNEFNQEIIRNKIDSLIFY
jgi:hypothetical protein